MATDSDWKISPWALQLLKEAGSYVEVTPSVTGLRVIGTAQGNPIHCKIPMPEDGSLENYRKATRYITVTGIQCDDELNKLINIDAVVDANKLINIDAVMDATVSRLKPGLAGRKNAKPNEAGKEFLPTPKPKPSG